jgi:lipopolysaccharide transport system ATP-binding protein
MSALTERCLVLEEGKCVFDGETRDSINEYFKYSKSSKLIYQSEPSTTKPKITNVKVITSEPNNIQDHGRPMEVRIEVSTPIPLQDAALSFDVINSLKQPIMYMWLLDSDRPICREKGVFEFCCLIPRVRLYIGHYTLTVHFSERFGKKNPQDVEEICPFEVVIYDRKHEFGWRPGLCTYLEEGEWTIKKK